MIPSFTTVEWAIIGGGFVSSVTLVFVFLDFYWSHIATERSDITIRKSASRESNHSSAGSSDRIYSPCTLANDGKRSGVIRAKKADIRFEPSGTEFSWEEMHEWDGANTPLVTLDHLEDSSIPANSTVEASIRLNPRRTERLVSMIEDQESIHIHATLDVEDNQGHYQIEYSDEVSLT